MNSPILLELLDKLNIAVFEHIEGSRFSLLSKKTEWLNTLFPDLSITANSIEIKDELTYLGNFMVDADSFWKSGKLGKLDSGIWNDTLPSGEACQFEACVLKLGDTRILIISIKALGSTEDHLREQEAKNNLLTLEDLMRTGEDLEKYSTLLEVEVQKRTSELATSYQILNKTFNDTISVIGNMVEIKDPYTAGHQVRVANLASAIASEMNLSDNLKRNIHISATIHDIGKMYVPADILSKPVKISELEYQILKTHVQYSYEILKGIEFPWPIAKIALQHHERIDGSGYPNGLKGDEILLEAKIIGVADVVEAMASHRPYRPKLSIDDALEEISKNKGTKYEAVVVDNCVKLFKEKGFKWPEQP